jgi:glycosyltransferase involved in cell wall biosynthesis
VRVLLVCHRYPPDGVAGVERVTQTLAAELAAGGDEVTVLTRRATGDGPLHAVSEVQSDQTTVRRIVGGSVDPRRFLGPYEQIERLVVELLVQMSPDVVHANHLLGLTPRLVELAHRQRIAVVVSLHDFFFACPLVHLQRPSGELCDGPDGGQACATTCFATEGQAAASRWILRTAYFRRVLRLAERVIFPSHDIAHYFAGFGVDSSRTRVIPNGTAVDADATANARRSNPRKRGRLHLAYLGTVVPHKGLHVALEALRLARVGDVELLAMGDLPDAAYAAHLRELATGIPGLRFALYGRYELRELTPMLADVDAVVVASQVRENFSLTAHEALARGIPVLSGRLGALRDAVQEGVNGFTFDQDRPSELATLLRRLVEEDQLLDHLREGAVSTRVASLEDHARMVRAIYEEARVEHGRAKTVCAADLEELRALHSGLVASGFAAPPPRSARAGRSQ